MPQVVVLPPFDREFFGSRDCINVSATSLFAVIEALDQEAPGFAKIAGVRAQFAVNGVIEPDWSCPLESASEVILLPRVGGG